MITEDYASFELAKLLKKKGFDIPVNYEYHYKITIPQFHKIKHNFNGIEYRNCSSEWYSAPTLQMTCKWLREIHGYYIQVMMDGWALGGHMGYYVLIQKTDSDFELMLADAVDKVFYETYEEAVEAACLYVLKNLI